MYGTVMIGRLAPTATADALNQTLQAWSGRERADGFVDAHVLLADDSQRVVIATRYASKEQYWALADNPEQDEWYRSTLAPLLDGDPTWIDGSWIM
jgi:heme-degrading monooxygenase HmoA